MHGKNLAGVSSVSPALTDATKVCSFVVSCQNKRGRGIKFKSMKLSILGETVVINLSIRTRMFLLPSSCSFI